MSEELKGTPRDFVYIGERSLQGGGRGTCLHWIKDDGTLSDTAIFTFDKRPVNLRVIGGVYTGARYDDAERTSYGVKGARYTKKWHDDIAVAAWEAEVAYEEQQAKLKRLGADDAKDFAFDRLTIAQVRDMRHAALARGDYIKAAAIASMARMRIDRRPSKEELLP